MLNRNVLSFSEFKITHEALTILRYNLYRIATSAATYNVNFAHSIGDIRGGGPYLTSGSILYINGNR